MIARSDTLLEVFDVMKEMFDELMEAVDDRFHRHDLMSARSSVPLGRTAGREQFGLREDESLRNVVEDYKGQVKALEMELDETKVRVLVDKFN